MSSTHITKLLSQVAAMLILMLFFYFREAKHFVGSLLQSLDSESPDVVNSALKNLPEFCVLCQGMVVYFLHSLCIYGFKFHFGQNQVLRNYQFTGALQFPPLSQS